MLDVNGLSLDVLWEGYIDLRQEPSDGTVLEPLRLSYYDTLTIISVLRSRSGTVQKLCNAPFTLAVTILLYPIFVFTKLIHIILVSALEWGRLVLFIGVYISILLSCHCPLHRVV